ncbi:hypothetical protein KWD80_04110 [Acinetobacter pittii]
MQKKLPIPDNLPNHLTDIFYHININLPKGDLKETVELDKAINQVNASDVYALQDYPLHNLSEYAGWALNSETTQSASKDSPLLGGVNMQLYWHTTKPSYNKLETVPENRIYISKQSADSFVKKFVNFSHGKVVSDTPKAAGVEIGRPNETYRRIRVESDFGKMTVLVTDGHLPYPYGHDMTGYEVKNLSETLDKATKSGATVLVNAYKTDGREAAMVQFPGGYIAEIHAATK